MHIVLRWSSVKSGCRLTQLHCRSATSTRNLSLFQTINPPVCGSLKTVRIPSEGEMFGSCLDPVLTPTAARTLRLGRPAFITSLAFVVGIWAAELERRATERGRLEKYKTVREPRVDGHLSTTLLRNNIIHILLLRTDSKQNVYPDEHYSIGCGRGSSRIIHSCCACT